MLERIGTLSFTTYSTQVYNSEIQHKNVVDLEARRNKKRRQEEEEFLILMAA